MASNGHFTLKMLAERVRFELTGLSSSGFQDRRNRPLCHLSAWAERSLPVSTVASHLDVAWRRDSSKPSSLKKRGAMGQPARMH